MTKINFLRTICVLCLTAMFCLPMNAMDRSTRGDVNKDSGVNINDATALISYLLSGDASLIADMSAADIEPDGLIDINDVTALINFLLTGEWPYTLPEPIEFTVSGVTFQMMLVEGGTFTMGAAEDAPFGPKPWEMPAHEVTLSDYYIGVTEVTQELWRAIMGTSTTNFPCWFCSNNGYSNNYQRPAENVTYAQCQSFITKLNTKTGKTFRMLTEAEWEYAARGGRYSRGYIYPGSNDVDAVAWHRGNIIQVSGKDITQPVGQKAPNELGLYDMGGNVNEWCSDWYGLYSSAAATNPTGPSTGTYRVVRGGSWDQAWRMCRVTYRYDGITPAFASPQRGLRLAMKAE